MHPVTFMVIPIAVVGLGYFIASSKKGAVGRTRIGSRSLDMHTIAPPALVFERLVAIGAPYRVDDSDPTSRTLVLSSPPTFTTWGFLYPVTITADDSGSRITVGIESRFIQIGPLVTRAHKQCLAAIEDLIGVPAARVATRA